MVEIEFKYRDQYTNGRWNTQHCTVESVQDCIDLYGLGIDCDYEIVWVKEVKND